MVCCKSHALSLFFSGQERPLFVRNILVVAFCGWLGVLVFCSELQAASGDKNTPTNQVFREQHRGDISFRFSVGPQLYQFSTASGELLSTAIGERSFSLYFFPEYSYYFLEKLAFFGSLPFVVDVDLLVGTKVGFGLSAGVRYFVVPWVYVDVQMTINFMRRSTLLLEFGGFALGLGFSIPLTQQARLLVIGQAPFNFIDGFVLSLRAYMGFEIYF